LSGIPIDRARVTQTQKEEDSYVRLTLVLSAGLALIWASSAASAQDLPSSVTGPYVEYQRALEAGDGAGAFDAARRAFEAGEAERIGHETLGLLAENMGMAAFALGDHSAAYRAWREAAELGERSGLAGTQLAWRWYNAMTEEALIFAPDAYFLHAQMTMSSGRMRGAYAPAEGFVALRRGRGTDLEASDATAHFIAGVSRLFRGDNVEAAFHLHMTADIADSQEDAPDWLKDVQLDARALEDLARGRARDDVARVDERLQAEPLYQSRHAPGMDDEERDLPPGMIDAVPIERNEPRYPRSAAINGQEGVVVVEFSIDETGRAVDGFVRTAIPSEVFDEESLRALENWRYELAMQDGVPVRRDGVIVSFTFMLR
jgi:TonB family protein